MSINSFAAFLPVVLAPVFGLLWYLNSKRLLAARHALLGARSQLDQCRKQLERSEFRCSERRAELSAKEVEIAALRDRLARRKHRATGLATGIGLAR